MIASMTGFGRHVVETGRERIAAEVRSVNAKGLKVSVRLPAELAAFQPEVEALVRSRIERGTVYLEVDYRATSSAESYVVDAAALKRYAREVATVKSELGIASPIDLERLMALPGVVAQRATAEDDAAALWERVREVVERALAALDESRRREGATIEAFLRERREEIARRLAAVRARLPEVAEAWRARFEERMKALLERASLAVESADLAREVALHAERTDLSEEASRLEAHLAEMDRALGPAAGPVGRRLEFLAQEMLREANTMGSKSQESGLVQDILAIKLEIDKIREQVANVE